MGDMPHTPPEAGLQLDLDIEAPEPDRFTIEHWLYITREYGDQVPEAPYELAPFPPMITPDATLRRQLQQWGNIDNAGRLTEETSQLLNAVTSAPVKLWGQVTFPENTHTRDLEVPEEARDWGLPEHVEVTPRVPFLVARHDGLMLLCTSTLAGATIAARATSAEPTRDLAAGMWEVIDSDKAWPAAKDIAVVPESLVSRVLEDAELGRYGTRPSKEDAQVRIAEIARDTGADPDCAPALANIAASDTAAVAQAIVSLTTSSTGVVRSFDKDAVGVIMLQGDAPSAVVTYPDRSHGQDVVAYVPGDVSHLQKGIEKLVSKANRSLRTRRS